MSIADKIEALTMPRVTDETRCFVSLSYFGGTVIDFVREDGTTWINRKTLDDVRRDHADAEEMTLGAFSAWKAARQDVPVEWEPTTEERFFEMLDCLPPVGYCSKGFLVGEPWDHHAVTGAARYQAFRKDGERFFVSRRPMTVEEWRNV